MLVTILVLGIVGDMREEVVYNIDNNNNNNRNQCILIHIHTYSNMYSTHIYFHLCIHTVTIDK